MSLLTLPNELLETILDFVPSNADLSSLCATHSTIFSAAVVHLYERNHLYENGSAVTWAVKNEQLETVHRATSVGVDIVRLHHLTRAAAFGQFDIFQCLWDAKASYGGFHNLNRDEDGGCPLLAGVTAGNYRIVKTLLDTERVNVEARDASSLTPLHIAAQNANDKLVKLLLEHGADPMACDRQGRVPLAMAAAPHNTPTVAVTRSRDSIMQCLILLLGYGAKLEYKEGGGETALYAAAASGQCDAVHVLAGFNADVNSTDGTGHTALHTTSLYLGKLEMTRMLLFHGADPNILNWDRQNALWMTRMTKEPAQIAEFLLQNGAKMVVDIRRKTPLHNAGAVGSADLVSVLMSHGADIHALDMNDSTPLHTAVVEPSSSAVIKRLIQYGANVEAKNNRGETPLACAMEHQPAHVIEYMLQKGSDPKAMTRSGAPVLFEAVRRESVELIKILIHYGADLRAVNAEGQGLVQCACKTGNPALVKFLLSIGTEFNTADKKDCTALMTAVKTESVPIISMLLKMGANVSTADKTKTTAMHLAAQRGSVVVTDMLLRHHAPINPKDGQRQTPLSIAAAAGDAKLVEFLLQNDADYNIADSKGNTPLKLAMEKDHEEVVDLLVIKGATIRSAGLKGSMRSFLR
jgi:ankyrin repeat protein